MPGDVGSARERLPERLPEPPGLWLAPLQSVAASSCPDCPCAHCRSRKADHIDTQAISFPSANVRTCFCWILGFAQRDGVLRRARPALVGVLSCAALGYGAWYAFSPGRLRHLRPRRGPSRPGLLVWHEIALILAVPLIDRFWDLPAFEENLPLDDRWFMFGIGWIPIAGFVLLCGWVEDVAACKKPCLLP